MTAPVTVLQVDREFRAAILKHIVEQLDRPCSDGDMIDDRNEAFDMFLARHRQQAEAASNAEVAELREALALAEDALRNHACSGFGIPCRRSTEQCRTDCGQMAGEALDAVILARAKSASEAGGV